MQFFRGFAMNTRDNWGKLVKICSENTPTGDSRIRKIWEYAENRKMSKDWVIIDDESPEGEKIAQVNEKTEEFKLRMDNQERFYNEVLGEVPMIRKFPLLHDYKTPQERRSLPWKFVEEYRKQIYHNHSGQSLERLADRNGLSIGEMALAISGRKVRSSDDIREFEDEEKSWGIICEALEEWRKRKG